MRGLGITASIIAWAMLASAAVAGDWYEVLGVSRLNSRTEIHQAYRKIAMENHPDRFPNEPDKEKRFRAAAEAWEVLGDPEKRARYDRLNPTAGAPPKSGAPLYQVAYDLASGRTQSRFALSLDPKNAEALTKKVAGLARNEAEVLAYFEARSDFFDQYYNYLGRSGVRIPNTDAWADRWAQRLMKESGRDRLPVWVRLYSDVFMASSSHLMAGGLPSAEAYQRGFELTDELVFRGNFQDKRLSRAIF